MKHTVILILALCLSYVALAQTPPQPPAISRPVSIGAPHVCPDYPAEAVAAQASGTTIVGFTITPNGTTTDVHVIQSSGNAALDASAVACAARWIYRPAMENGKPVPVPWKAEVRAVYRPVENPTGRAVPIMVGKGNKIVFGPVALTSHDCKRFAPAGDHAGKVTTVVVRISVAGLVTTVEMAESSGDRALDDAAVQCARQWTYNPAYDASGQVEFDLRENVAWGE